MKGNWLINVKTESSFENEITLNKIIKLYGAADKQINFYNLYSYSPINGTCYRLLCNRLSLYFLWQAQLHIIEADHTFSNCFLLALVHQSIALRAVTIYRPETQTNKLKLIFSEFLTFVWLLSSKFHDCLSFVIKMRKMAKLRQKLLKGLCHGRPVHFV